MPFPSACFQLSPGPLALFIDLLGSYLEGEGTEPTLGTGISSGISRFSQQLASYYRPQTLMIRSYSSFRSSFAQPGSPGISGIWQASVGQISSFPQRYPLAFQSFPWRFLRIWPTSAGICLSFPALVPLFLAFYQGFGPPYMNICCWAQ